MVCERAFIFQLHISLGKTLSLVSRSSVKVKVKSQGHIFQKIAVAIHFSQSYLVWIPVCIHFRFPTEEMVPGKAKSCKSCNYCPLNPLPHKPNFQIVVSPFVHIFDILSLFAAELEEPKIGISGKGLN